MTLLPPLAAVAASLLLPLTPAPVSSLASAASGPATADRATVREILDGSELWIEQRRARVDDRATTPELLRTGTSRAHLSLRPGAAGRMNRFTRLRLGSSCFLLDQGQILLSGPQSLCIRSTRLSVRGTHVLIDLDSQGTATISVLEGQVELEPLSMPTPSVTPVNQGQRLRLSAEGRVLAREPLTAADYRSFVDGPLVDGFTTPLPGQPALESTLGAIEPGLTLACAARPETGLTAAINQLRLQAGRPAFTSLPADLAERNCRHLAPVLRRILTGGNCDHDYERWQALRQEESREAGLTPVSELIACPGPDPIQPATVLQRWQGSPLHTDLLLHRPRASHLDCVQLTVSGRTSAMCTTWGSDSPPKGL